MAYKTKEELEKGEEKWRSSALQQRDPAGYKQHKDNVAAFKSGGGISKKELNTITNKARKDEREKLMSMYIIKDMSGTSTEDLLNYQPDYSGKVKFDEKMAEIRGVGETLRENLSEDRGVKRIGGFEQNEKLVKLRGPDAEYDRGGRYLGGGNIPTQKDKYVDSKGQLQTITKRMKESDPYGQLAVQRTYKEMVPLSKKSSKSFTKLAKSLGVKNKQIKKALKP